MSAAAGGARAGPPPTGRRRLVLACLLLAAGGLALWGAGELTWFSAPAAATTGPAGPAATGSTVAVSGAALQPVPVGVGLLALAGSAAAVAVAGVARRVLGGALVLAALGAAWATATTALSRPAPAQLAELAGTAVAAPVSGSAAPLLALAGVLAVLAGGLVLVLAEAGMPALGSRYRAPAGRRHRDPDRSAWEELDAGRDPTADGPRGADQA